MSLFTHLHVITNMTDFSVEHKFLKNILGTIYCVMRVNLNCHQKAAEK